MRIYLSGPIFGCNDWEMHNFRDLMKFVLKKPKYTLFDPTDRKLQSDDPEHLKAIVEGDKQELLSCDLMLVDLWKISAGTSMEILLAWQNNIPVVIRARDPITSPWIVYHATKICRSLDETLQYIDELRTKHDNRHIA